MSADGLARPSRVAINPVRFLSAICRVRFGSAVGIKRFAIRWVRSFAVIVLDPAVQRTIDGGYGRGFERNRSA